jgi:DNA-binding NarL/FixJ family response regulator
MDIRVSIFEDNKLVREAYEAILNGTPGYTCTGCFSSCNNLKHDIPRSQPDVVLMDIEMTGINGIEATQIIKLQWPDIKILIQTVFDDDEKIFAAICAGASGYVLKNTSPVSLLQAVTEVYSGGAPMSPVIASKVIGLFKEMSPAHQLSRSEEIDLSQRERDILRMMTEGFDFRTIAEKSFISYETVRTHVKKIYRKLHVASAREAIIKASKQRIV